MKSIAFTFSFILFIQLQLLHAQVVKGLVKDAYGMPLSYASIVIKGSTVGTTSNAQGHFSVQTTVENPTIICMHVGYKTEEKTIHLNHADIDIEFILQEQVYQLKEVIIRSSDEDPAYPIIRKAIANRKKYLNEWEEFQCEVYLKGNLQLRNYPKKFLGENVDFEDGDTSKRKMIYLSESVAKYAVQGKTNKKIEVVSTKVSGRSDGFGLGIPRVISFYENNVSIGRGLNPRGFISPISDNALQYYQYHYAGTFFENGIEINRIKVIPKRSYEPLFTGYINIVENEWRLQNVQLSLLKEQQMQYLDTLNIEQLYMPFKNTWVLQQQVIYPAGKFFSFDFFGSFVQVFDKFNLEPHFAKKYFDNTILKFADSSNKHSLQYWDSVRPITLSETEKKDYKKKDSLEQVRKDPAYLDSIDRKNNKISLSKLILFGQNFNSEKNKSSFSLKSLINSFYNYNLAEGWVANISGTYFKKLQGRSNLSITPTVRYGFSNRHLNADIEMNYNYGKKYFNTIQFSFGKKIFQFDNNNQISQLDNTLSTLQWTRNHMKIYEAHFIQLNHERGLGNGFKIDGGIEIQNRMPLENTSNYYWRKVPERTFTPNYPTSIATTNIKQHQALIANLGLSWQAGVKYIEMPDRKIALGSKYPLFYASVTKGINNLLGSDVDYTKWDFSIAHNLNLKLLGLLRVKVKIGGFLNADKVTPVDYNHYLGSEVSTATDYMNGFQMMPYYAYSNIEKFYTAAHVEYHLNGFLSNKIPGFKKLNWHFVIGLNILNAANNNQYTEGFISIENIFKIMRIDFVQQFTNNQNRTPIAGIRYSIPLLGNRK